MKLVHAPIWVVFRRVPPELWSEVGFNTMASAVGIPVHSESPTLKPYTNGIVKLKLLTPSLSSVVPLEVSGNLIEIQSSGSEREEVGELSTNPSSPLAESSPPLVAVLQLSDPLPLAIPVSVNLLSATPTLRTPSPGSLSTSASSPSYNWVAVVKRSRPPPLCNRRQKKLYWALQSIGVKILGFPLLQALFWFVSIGTAAFKQCSYFRYLSV
ncbi:unnamed protein product [Microthlaspi erraticum]|uniref:Uncharacterized protein n=1 Tax=Microthlaspi erraticum TaxID=1685480 RepID=A0A6D2IQ12_9BRAS|nr:unnamed protein product [Microthlaspi erraticum]